MPPKNRGLGRGLGALIPGAENKKKTDYTLYPIEKINPNPRQPRQTFDQDSLIGLAESIKGVGIIEPIILQRQDDEFILIAGERRLRAAKLLGLVNVPGIVIDRDVNDSEMMYMALIENSQREDLNPIELASGIRLLIDNTGATQEQVGEKIGMARPTLANLLRLLTLPLAVRELIAEGIITSGHAKSLLALDDEQDQIDAAQRIADEGFTVRETEQLVKDTVKERKRKPKPKPTDDPNLIRAIEALRDCLGTKVNIKTRGKGGRIVIDYYSLAELNGLIDRLLDS
jgi:ParB family transcriptional regulator, chromosome partitioning protein